MNGPGTLGISDDDKRLILWAELGALLHDIGKLSNIFLEYRKGWQDRRPFPILPSQKHFKVKKTWPEQWHWHNDPHDHSFLGFDRSWDRLKSFPELWRCLTKYEFSYLHSVFPWPATLKKLVDEHIKTYDEIICNLKISDSKDSAENRNTPLWCREQRTEPIKASSPFGTEKDLHQDQDDLRSQLYQALDKLLPQYWHALTKTDPYQVLYPNLMKLRGDILRACQEAMIHGLSDTCRPAHDITLWDHAFGTACLFKAFLANLAFGFNLTDPSEEAEVRMVKALQEYGATEFDKAHFALLGFGWDGLSYLERGEKIGDSVGRARKLEDLKQELRSLVEVRWCLGNRIYADENGVYFLIPRLGEEDTGADYPPALQELVQTARDLAQEVTYGELPLRVGVVPTTEYLNGIVTLMETLRRKWSVPWDGKDGTGIITHFSEEAKEVCPVCRLRGTEDRLTTVCLPCQEIRKLGREGDKEAGPVDKPGTIYMGEIVGTSKGNPSNKAAMLVACFGLREWLNGRMLYSLFVKEAQTLRDEVTLRHNGIEGLDADDSGTERNKVMDEASQILTRWGTEPLGYDTIMKDIQSLSSMVRLKGQDFGKNGTTYEEAIARIYFPYVDLRMLDSLERFLADLGITVYDGERVGLENFLLTQNHTPSRLLAIWQETERFFGDLVYSLPDTLEKLGFPPKHRARLLFQNRTHKACLIKEIDQAKITGVLELTLEGAPPLEVMRRGQDFFTVNLPIEDAPADYRARRILAVQGEDAKEKISLTLGQDCIIDRLERSDLAYHPYRRLLTSPLVFMAMVPGSAALEVANHIRKEYDQRFAKVKGRLPLSLGIVFFGEHTPMFAVLDTGKRMIRNFEDLYRAGPVSFRVKRSPQNPPTSTFRLRQHRDEEAEFPETFTGDLGQDPHFPYVLTPLRLDRPSYFDTLPGHVLHFRDVQDDDEILAYPNYLDILHLDATTRRFQVSLPAAGENQPHRRKRTAASHLPDTYPYFLDELADIKELWQSLVKSRISDSSLRGVEGLLLSKLAEWAPAAPGSIWEDAVWRDLAAATITRNFAKEHRQEITQAVYSGLFFDTLELYLRILKKRLRGAEA